MRIQKKSSRALKRAMATVLSLALAMSAVAVAPTADAASKKKPKLSAKKKTLYYNGKKTFTLKVKKNKVKKIKKTTWKTSNKKVVKISKKKKTSVKLTAKKKGSAKITATVKYTVKGSKKVKTAKLTCKVTSKKKSSGGGTSTKTNAPASKAPTTTAPAGGGQGGTQSKAPAASQPAASEPATSAAPSAEASAPAASTEPSAEASAPAASTEPSAKASAPAASTEPSAKASAPAASTEPSAKASAPAASTEPSAKASAPAASTEPSAKASVAPSAAASVAPSITPTVNPASGSATVAITGSAVSGSAIKMNVGETKEVTAFTTVSGCAVTEYTWASSDTDVAAVSGSGAKAEVTAKGEGDAEISVTIKTDTGLTETAKVAVKVDIPGSATVVITGSAASVREGQTFQLEVSITDEKDCTVDPTKCKWSVDPVDGALEISGSDVGADVTLKAVKTGKAKVVVSAKSDAGKTFTAEREINVKVDTDVELTNANLLGMTGRLYDAEGNAMSNGQGIENPDGSITFYTSAIYSGGGLQFYLNADKSGFDVSQYSKIIVTASSKETDRQLTVDLITDGKKVPSWGGDPVITAVNLGYPSLDGNGQDTKSECDLSKVTIPQDTDKGANIKVLGVQIKLNGYNKPASGATEAEQEAYKASITVKSIKLVK